MAQIRTMRSADAKPASLLVLQLQGLNAFLAAVPARRAIADAFAECAAGSWSRPGTFALSSS